MPTLPQRRRIRLAAGAYADTSAVCAITIAVAHRTLVFADPAVAAAATAVLRDHAAKTDVVLIAWCVMPDHIHLVVAPSQQCDLLSFVGQFKNLVQRSAWQLGVVGAFWQKGFWDRFIRNDIALAQVVRYVLDNPVRAGLAGAAEDYPFSGVMEGVL